MNHSIGNTFKVLQVGLAHMVVAPRSPSATGVGQNLIFAIQKVHGNSACILSRIHRRRFPTSRRHAKPRRWARAPVDWPMDMVPQSLRMLFADTIRMVRQCLLQTSLRVERTACAARSGFAPLAEFIPRVSKETHPFIVVQVAQSRLETSRSHVPNRCRLPGKAGQCRAMLRFLKQRPSDVDAVTQQGDS